MLRIKEGFKGQRALTLPLAATRFMEENPITSLLYVTHIGYYPAARHHHRERHDSIDQWIFIYCTDGEGFYEIEGVRHSIAANQYFIIPSGKQHTYSADANKPWTIYWIHFKGSLAVEMFRNFDTPRTISSSLDSRISDRIELFEQIFNTLERGYSQQNLQFASGILIYFFSTIAFVNEYRAASGQRTGSVVELATHYILENIEKKISVTDLSKVLGYSTSHISLLFKREFGSSPTEYINSLKIRESCRLLDFTPMRINQICPKVGIDDSYYFTRLFTKIMGVSPTEYRRHKKG